MTEGPIKLLKIDNRSWDQGAYLSILAAAPAEEVKRFVDDWILPEVETVDVIENRTGLVMIPARDTVAGKVFHIGEALVSEAKARVGSQVGYAACLGRDREQALAVAILDALIRSGARHELIAPMVSAWERRQQAETEDEMRHVEATRVEMETF